MQRQRSDACCVVKVIDTCVAQEGCMAPCRGARARCTHVVHLVQLQRVSVIGAGASQSVKYDLVGHMKW